MDNDFEILYSCGGIVIVVVLRSYERFILLYSNFARELCKILNRGVLWSSTLLHGGVCMYFYKRRNE